MKPPFQTKIGALTPQAKQLECEGSHSFHLKPRSRISGAIPILPHIFTACIGTNLHFILLLAFLLITIKTVSSCLLTIHEMEKPSSQIKEHTALSDTVHIFITVKKAKQCSQYID